MLKTVLQVPLDKKLKSSAEKAASEQGFSSLQEIVRVFLTQLAAKRVEMNLQEAMVLSPQNEDRYSQMSEDFKAGRYINSAHTVQDLVSQLNKE